MNMLNDFNKMCLCFRQVEWKGLSGPIEFKEGRRVQFKLDLVKLKQQSLVKVGEWQPFSGLNITDRSILFETGRMNVTLLVVTILVRFLRSFVILMNPILYCCFLFTVMYGTDE